MPHHIRAVIPEKILQLVPWQPVQRILWPDQWPKKAT
jgi:hypothetical protein